MGTKNHKHFGPGYNDFHALLMEDLKDITAEHYVCLYSDVAVLDGYFTPQELRRLADTMDELKEYCQDHDTS
ncbi:MAG: hypothetical protein ACW99F_07220 [Candidatus Hodarchaeales archaeon]|jgi:hypothetical protein